MRKVPRFLLRVLGVVGDAATLVGRDFPLTSSRYRSMTTDYPVPMERTFEVFGAPPISLKQGVEETVEWLEGSA